MNNFHTELVNKRHPYDKSHIDLTYVTHFYCNQKKIDAVTELLKQYEQYPSELLDRIEFVIIDDCSPIEYEIPDINLNFRWLRITTDIQWNQGGARNLGVTFAKSDKILLSDLDHAFPRQKHSSISLIGVTQGGIFISYIVSALMVNITKATLTCFL